MEATKIKKIKIKEKHSPHWLVASEDNEEKFFDPNIGGHMSFSFTEPS